MKNGEYMKNKVILYLAAKGFFRYLPDEIYLKMIYRAELGKKLNLKNPQSFNEKLNWKKLNDRKPVYTEMADKYLVKQYVAERIGENYIIPLYGVWDQFEDIDFDMLPKTFVLKSTHDCGGVVICKDKDMINKKLVGEFFEKRLRKNYFWWRREWPYKDITPRIIAEEYVKDQNQEHLPVYKFFCFHGVPRIIQSIQNDKQEDETIDYFDVKWNLLDLKQNFPNSKMPLEKPDMLEEMVAVASELSEGHDFIRVDLYVINNQIKFSEFTFYSDAGINVFEPESWDKKLGSWINLKVNNTK